MALCAELSNENIIEHIDTFLQDKSIYMVFGYCEHDLLHIVHYHYQSLQKPVPANTIRSIMLQLLNGCQYLHTNWVMHRDLKPANIMVTSTGQVKIGDLGLARIFREPLLPLVTGDKVVVTIWYRAPELLLGAKHYTPAVDLWAVGCIFGELLSLRPIFKGEEVKMDNRKALPFQKNQMEKIVKILGLPNEDRWPLLLTHPEYNQLFQISAPGHRTSQVNGLEKWYHEILKSSQYPQDQTPGLEGFKLLSELLEYNPDQRLTAERALQHPYFTTGSPPSRDCFEGSVIVYPRRKLTDDSAATQSGTKRTGLLEEPLTSRPTKRLKDD